MEELLNKLIEKGWKPWGNKKEIGKFIMRKRGRSIERPQSQCMIYFYDKDDYCFMAYSLRELVSKESGLWQFVCENNLIQTEHYGIIDNGERAKNVFYKIDTYDEEGDVIETGDMEGDMFIHISKPEYRLIESALKDESELENFLLYNVKVDG